MESEGTGFFGGPMDIKVDLNKVMQAIEKCCPPLSEETPLVIGYFTYDEQGNRTFHSVHSADPLPGETAEEHTRRQQRIQEARARWE